MDDAIALIFSLSRPATVVRIHTAPVAAEVVDLQGLGYRVPVKLKCYTVGADCSTVEPDGPISSTVPGGHTIPTAGYVVDGVLLIEPIFNGALSHMDNVYRPYNGVNRSI